MDKRPTKPATPGDKRASEALPIFEGSEVCNARWTLLLCREAGAERIALSFLKPKQDRYIILLLCVDRVRGLLLAVSFIWNGLCELHDGVGCTSMIRTSIYLCICCYYIIYQQLFGGRCKNTPPCLFHANGTPAAGSKRASDGSRGARQKGGSLGDQGRAGWPDW